MDRAGLKNLLDLYVMGIMQLPHEREMIQMTEISVPGKYSGVLCVLYFFSLFLLVNFFFHINYEENDDVVMGLIASGAYSNSPDYHLVFIHSLIGFLLSSFYRLSSGTEFYTLLMISFNVLSFAALLNVFFRLFSHPRLKVIFLLFFGTLFMYQLSVLQFTRTASFLAISGITVTLLGKNKYAGGLLLLSGFLLRFHAAMLIVLLSLPLCFYHLMMLRTAERLKKRIVFAALLISVVIFKSIDGVSYRSSEEWSSYEAYNLLRGKLNDNPNLEKASHHLPKDFPENEYMLLASFLPNPALVSSDKLKSLNDHVSQIPFFNKLHNIKILFLYKNHLLLLCLSLLTLCFFFPENRLLIASLFLFNIFFMCVVSVDGTLKSRVFFSSFFATLVFALSSLGGIHLKNINLLFCLVGLFLVLFLFTSIKAYSINKKNREVFLQQNEMIMSYLSNNRVIIPFGTSYNIQHSNPFSFSSSFPSGNMFFGGWLTNIPFNKNRFDSFAYFINHYAILVDDRYCKKASLLVASSVFNETKISVKPKLVLSKYGLSILEFHTEEKR